MHRLRRHAIINSKLFSSKNVCFSIIDNIPLNSRIFLAVQADQQPSCVWNKTDANFNGVLQKKRYRQHATTYTPTESLPHASLSFAKLC